MSSQPIKVIFLDIDGVLNSIAFFKFFLKQNSRIVSSPDDKIDPDAVSRLNNITNVTGAKIVISSTWRLSWKNNFQGLIDLLKQHSVAGDIIGMTEYLNISHGRGKEIKHWMYNHPEYDVIKFIILDDDSDMDNIINRLIKTSTNFGLLDQHVELAINMLN